MRHVDGTRRLPLRVSGRLPAFVACVLLIGVPGVALAAGASIGVSHGSGLGVTAPTVDPANVEAIATSEMSALGIPGLAVAIVQGDQISYTSGFGKADETGRAVTPDTPFVLGSVSKSFTAIAVMQLVETGHIALDAPVQQYLPWFTLADASTAARITVRQLLNQTSGLDRRIGDSFEQFASGPGAMETNVRALAAFRPVFQPGTAFAYSNANYEILGVLVQAISGQPFGQYVQTHIFAPLGMTHSYTALEPARAAGLAEGYRTSMFGGPVAAADWPYLDGELASGFLVSSARDMAHYLSAHLDSGRYGAKTLGLSPAGLALLHTVPPDVPGSTYAMGWAPSAVGGDALGHSGSVPGYMNSMTIVPNLGLGVVVLSNRHSMQDGLRLSQMSDEITTALLGGAWTPAPSDPLMLILLAVVAAIFVWQLISVAVGLRLSRRPLRRAAFMWAAIVTLAAMDLAAVAFRFSVLPTIMQSSTAITHLYAPDFIDSVTTLVWFSVGWGVIRTVLLVAATTRRGPWLEKPGRRVLVGHAAPG